jgi:hypothetical protein
MDQEPMLRVRIAAFTAIVACLLAGPASADSKHQLCIGDNEDQCPAEHEAFSDAARTRSRSACMLCTAMVKGKYQPQPYQIVRSGARDGDSCGYRLYEITCLDHWWGDLFSRRPRH